MKLLTLLVIIACILIIKTTAHWDDCDEDVNGWEDNRRKESDMEEYDWDEEHDHDEDDDWNSSDNWDGDDDDCEEDDDDWNDDEDCEEDDDGWDNDNDSGEDNDDDCEEDNDDDDDDNRDRDQEDVGKNGYNDSKENWGTETFHMVPTKPGSIETWPVPTYGLPSSSSPPGVPFTVTATSTQLYTITGLPPLPQPDHIVSMSSTNSVNAYMPIIVAMALVLHCYC